MSGGTAASLVVVAGATLFLPARAARPAGPSPFVAYAELSGSVDPGSGAYLLDALHEAEAAGAEAFVVRLDTPGGLLATTRDVVQAELSSRVPVIVWVGPPGARAGSAGVFLTLAANVAAMAPSSNIGAAHPIGPGGGGGKAENGQGSTNGDGDVMIRKIENDTAAFIAGIAERRSRNVEWAQKAVRDSVSITASRALELKVIDLIAEDVPDLLRKLDGRRVDLGAGDVRRLRTAGAELRPVSWPLRNRVLHFLANPEIAYLIAMLGVLGVMAELYHPGTVVPGVVGALCLVVAGVAFQMLPINAGALALLALGLGLIVAELWVGGHGAFIVLGAICVLIGSLFLVGHVGAGYFADRDFGVGARDVIPVALALLVIGFTLATKVSRSARKKLLSGASGLVGMVGEVKEPIEGAAGRLLVNGELWTARSAFALPAGSRARVRAVEGLVLEVEPEGASSPAEDLAHRSREG